MLFSSWIFIAAFLPVTWIVFTFLQNRAGRDMAMLWLALASLFFYSWLSPIYTIVILLSICFNFAVGSTLATTHMRRVSKKALLIFGLFANLAALGYYKYTGLFFETLNLLGGNHVVPHIVLPLAISFFTFQQIAYLVDAYRGEVKELNFRNYSLFVTFFPQLIAGPIVHHKEIMPEFSLRRPKAELTKMQIMGLTLFVIGLFKKVAIADHMGEVADPVFQNAAMALPLSLFEAWLGAISYTLQIYFDFSGYSDMAIGLAALFGIKLPLNFLSPYKAVNIIDFWRRWHITLSRFLRDYLYIPLGGNRKGPARRYLNLIITMILGGFWHGANWTFAIWGLLHGIYLVINHAWQKIAPFKIPRPIAIAITFFFVIVAWVFFRADSITSALHVLNGMTGAHGITVRDLDSTLGKILQALGFHVTELNTRILRLNEKWYIFWIALAIVFFAPNAHELMQKKLAIDISKIDEETKKPKLIWQPNIWWAIAIALMAATSLLLLTNVSAFIYFQF